jgi:hypothetical protein
VAAALVALAAQMVYGQAQPATSVSQIQAVTTSSGAASTVIQLTLPPDVQASTLSATLNGKDVTSSFISATCSAGTCELATFTAQDGLNANKNVLSVVARRTDGSLASVRDRFAIEQGVAAVAARVNSPGVRADNVAATLPTLNSFLPPAIALTTLQGGGYTVNQPWIQVGSQNTYPANPSGFQCQSPSVYSVIVLDKQTLTEKTAAPESSPMCVANGVALKTYLATLTSDDLVIVGSNQGISSDAGATCTTFRYC